jgi:hypothetical protein
VAELQGVYVLRFARSPSQAVAKSLAPASPLLPMTPPAAATGDEPLLRSHHHLSVTKFCKKYQNNLASVEISRNLTTAN